jgi:hypothetical protein
MNDKKDTYSIRTMLRSEVDSAVDLAANESWNPWLHDADCFFNTDPNGFFIGLLEAIRNRGLLWPTAMSGMKAQQQRRLRAGIACELHSYTQ